jgi:hypothetical protein
VLHLRDVASAPVVTSRIGENRDAEAVRDLQHFSGAAGRSLLEHNNDKADICVGALQGFTGY